MLKKILNALIAKPGSGKPRKGVSYNYSCLPRAYAFMSLNNNNNNNNKSNIKRKIKIIMI
jgi:hypothetical protein